RKTAVVPVEANVAAILRPTCPDFPSPQTISLPLHSSIRQTASSNGPSRPLARASSARASSCNTARPNSRTLTGEVRSAAITRALASGQGAVKRLTTFHPPAWVPREGETNGQETDPLHSDCASPRDYRRLGSQRGHRRRHAC